MGSCGVVWGLIGFYGVLWGLLESSGDLWGLMGFDGVKGVLWGLVRSDGGEPAVGVDCSCLDFLQNKLVGQVRDVP